MPFGAVRSWMAGEVSGPVADVDGASDPVGVSGRGQDPFRVLAQRSTSTPGSDGSALRWQWIEARGLRPGDRIVVPPLRGGHDRFGWAPTSVDAVVDVSEAVGFTPSRSRREPTLRLDGELPARLGIDDDDLSTLVRTAADLSRMPEDVDDPVSIDEVARALAAHLPHHPPSGRGWSEDGWRLLRSWLTSGELRVIDLTDPDDAQLAGYTPRPWARLLAGARPATVTRPTIAVGDDHEVAASSVGSCQRLVNLDPRSARET